MKTEKTELFETIPAGKAVITMAVPMVISQAITVIYNVADTFFVGQLNDPDQVAAVTLSLPLFFFLNAITNLFGVGGASRVSYFLGQNAPDKARGCSAFCIWTAVGATILYSVLIGLLRPALLPVIGADATTYPYAYKYLFWTISIGAVPTVLNPLLANLIRAQGYSKQAGFGVALGGIVNIVLDPVFIFALHLNIVGAAVATMLSAWLATAWFLLFMYRKKRELAITLNPAYYTLDRSIALQTVLTGLPNFVISSMATLSNSVLNTLIAAYSNKALAGIGIAKKIDLLAFAIAQGVTQGTLPLISYNYAAKNKKRMLEVIKATALCGLLFACCGLCLLMVSAAPLSRAFIADAETAAYSRYFLRVISLTCPSTTLTLLSITVFQATGKKVQPIFLSALRKGLLDIPLMFLLNHFFAVKGLAWAIPAADIGAMVIALSMVVPHLKRLDKHPLEQAQ